MGKGFQAVGQSGAALHIMAVLQAYQANLLKDLSMSWDIDEEAFSELSWATALPLQVTKQIHAIGYSMAGMVIPERNLWLNITRNKDRDRVFLLDAPVLPLGLLGDSVNAVVSRFWEA